MKRRNIFKKQNVSKKIAFSFFIVIFIGAFLLMLPISNQNGLFLHPVDALFTATSATCVTGLVTIVPASQFTLFGKNSTNSINANRWNRINDTCC